MLYHSRGTVFDPWSSGAAQFYPKDEAISEQPVLGVNCRIGGKLDVVALLDTGAQWSVIGDQMAMLLQEEIEDLGLPPIPYSTRMGPQQGRQCSTLIELLADSGSGSNLVCTATVLVVPGWKGPPVLGFFGFLERIRMALDPDDDAPTFYFGARP